ncbi:hypothetical protein [Telmatospirillum sp.]|uniref:hypothetical protein n=1 Tax=Telmatospirillum sp. TaxID=2079197 RepID=UPI00283C1900|nr:hypothetical protein [Telmatospirillum sp.]MDR3436455.1 hypothetical protein [Telmatospirillum sp.]
MFVDLTALTDEQLAAFNLIDAAAVSAERVRRAAYPDISSFLTDLAQAALNLDVTINSFTRKTAATRAVEDTNIIGIIQRGLATARLAEVAFTEPTLEAPVELEDPEPAAVVAVTDSTTAS